MSDKGKAVNKFLLDQVLALTTEYATEGVKHIANKAISDSALLLGVDLLTDYVGSSIPIVGNVISTYKRDRQYRNIQLAIQKLQKDNDNIKRKFDMQTDENKIVLDQIFELTLEKVADTKQQEKLNSLFTGTKKCLI